MTIWYPRPMSARPPLDTKLSPESFLDHYWLKDELAAFCKANGVGAAGAKADLTARIAAFLAGDALPATGAGRKHVAMPSALSLDLVIGLGWRCSQELRGFLSAQLGKPFRFDRFMREQIRDGAGHTLRHVLEAWKADVATRGRSAIEPQFEYNRFVREFRDWRPEALHKDVVAAWRSYRSAPASERPSVAQLARDGSLPGEDPKRRDGPQQVVTPSASECEASLLQAPPDCDALQSHFLRRK